MFKTWIISGGTAHRGWSPLWKLRGAVALLSLTIAIGARAQASGSLAPDASVDQSFSSLHEALNSTANDLLADAQRPGGKASSNPAFEEAPVSAFPAGGFDKLRPGYQRNLAWTRLRVLRPILDEILREEGLPSELLGVILVESGGSPTALSPRGARGIWQFMPDTARRYGLAVTPGVDERLDIYKSTHAAAHYLRDLYAEFGSWPLALAAYNAGEDAVQRALDRAPNRDFISIARAGMLPLETQNYVPAVLNAMGMLRTTGGTLITTGTRESATRSVVYAAVVGD
jgi:hypothetical protein